MGYNPKTVKTVLNVIQKEFESEENRNKHIMSKVQIMLTIAGILLTAITFLLKIVFEQNWHTKLTVPSLIIVMFLIIGAIILFLHVIRVKTFKRIKYEALVFSRELEKDPIDVESRLIATYEDALKENVIVVDSMIKIFKVGTLLIQISIYMLSIILLWILIIIFKIL